MKHPDPKSADQSHPSRLPASDPATLDRLLDEAMAHQRAGQLPQAETICRQILEASPEQAGAWYLMGVIACQVGQFAMALQLLDQAILVNPDYAEAHHYRGIALHALQRYEETLESCDKAILLRPDSAETYFNRGIALHALQRYQAAVESYEKAISLKPEYAEAYGNRGITLNALQQHHAAKDSCEKAISLKPEFAEAYANRGNALHALRRYQSALESYDMALALDPQSAQTHNNRGSALHALFRNDAALESFDRAIALKPEDALAYCNRGNVLVTLKQYQGALESFDKALLAKPEDSALAYSNRGYVLATLKQYEAALESFDNALLAKPDYEYLRGSRLHIRSFLCDWKNIETEFGELEVAIGRGEKAAVPLAISGTPLAQKQAAEIYVRDKYSAGSTLPKIPRHRKQDSLRIGYFSADYHNHPTSYLMAELFERHDRSRFEIIGFSFGPQTGDEMSKRVAAAMDRFIDVQAMQDRDIAQLSRELEVDIAVDLKGFTTDARTGIFAERAAPIQVNYLGYPGTMGAPFMDYLIADQTLIPEASQQYYSEKIIYLPDTYQANDSQHPISAKPCTRTGEGLPETAFVFCCFNTAYKISPSVFDIWMRILARVPGSVLWLLEDNPIAAANLHKEADRRGIAPERLVFAKPRPLPEHLARVRLADLFLDTFPYNAHTTASDALRVGLPVLTRMGETFASRVAASLLRAIGLPELITTDMQAYEALAIELAHNRERLRDLRERLNRNRLTSPLFDTAAFTRHIEAAYTAIYARYRAALPPDHIHIPRSAGYYASAAPASPPPPHSS